jgi:Lipid A 3-O-deacylase (PagL)
MLSMRWILAVFALTPLVSVEAGSDRASPGRTENAPSEFAKGSFDFEAVSGAFFSLNSGSTRPTVNYAIEAVRFGIMLTNEGRSGVLGGNEELLLEVFGGPIFTGPGDGLGGTTIIFRHNFLPSNRSLVPFWQIGGGGVYSDLSSAQSQTLVGSRLDFNLQTGIGLRCRVNRSWSIRTEIDYRHISNAGLTTRNSGLDSLGGTLGLGFLF